MDAQETNSEIPTTSCLWRLVSCPNLIEKQFPNSFVVYLRCLPNNVTEAIKKQIYVTETIAKKNTSWIKQTADSQQLSTPTWNEMLEGTACWQVFPRSRSYYTV